MVYKSCGCGEDLTLAEWLRLPLVGRRAMERGEPVLEYRNCACGSTLAIEMPARPRTIDDSLCETADALRIAGFDEAASDVLRLRFEP